MSGERDGDARVETEKKSGRVAVFARTSPNAPSARATLFRGEKTKRRRAVVRADVARENPSSGTETAEKPLRLIGATGETARPKPGGRNVSKAIRNRVTQRGKGSTNACAFPRTVSRTPPSTPGSAHT